MPLEGLKAEDLLPITNKKSKSMNIAEILRNAPKGTKLYSPIFGDVKLECVANWGVHQIRVSFLDATLQRCIADFTSDGRFTVKVGECLLFPSKKNRDWPTFKVKSQFPTTIKESSEVLDLSVDTEDWYKEDKIGVLRNLLICRDAWWKLDDYWEPDWTDSDTDKWVIENYDEDIRVDAYTNTNFILAFRTEEIANKFLETFHDLIESCQELI